MEVYTSLDEVSYRRKPERKEIPAIRKRLAEGWMGIEVKELAERVGEHGHTIVPGHMQGGIKAENCTAMQLFVLDFDDGATFGQILKRCNQFSIPVTFAYHTFSSTEAKEKFRVVFVYDQVLDDPFVIKLILIMLHRIFPECDKSCKNLDRMFYGGKELIYLNEDARFALVQLLTPFYQSLDVGDNFKRNIRSFCKKQKILLVNDMPAIMEIGQLEKVGKIDGIEDSAIVHLIGESANPSFFIMESRKEEAAHQNFTCKEGVRNLGITGDVACQLLADFNNGLNLSHDVKFALCTNLMHIKGGQKHFLDMLEKYEGSEAYGKWKNDIDFTVGDLEKGKEQHSGFAIRKEFWDVPGGVALFERGTKIR